MQDMDPATGSLRAQAGMHPPNRPRQPSVIPVLIAMEGSRPPRRAGSTESPSHRRCLVKRPAPRPSKRTDVKPPQAPESLPADTNPSTSPGLTLTISPAPSLGETWPRPLAHSSTGNSRHKHRNSDDSTIGSSVASNNGDATDAAHVSLDAALISQQAMSPRSIPKSGRPTAGRNEQVGTAPKSPGHRAQA